MALLEKNETTFTYPQVSAWREQLFQDRSLRIPVGELNAWPLGRYLWAAVLQAAHLDDLREGTEQEWQTPAWDFGRFAKAHPLLVDLDENRALVEIKRTIGRTFWTDHLHMEAADAEMAFDSVWVECRAVPGYDRLTVAVLEAKESESVANPNVPAGYTTFLKIAWLLQRQLPTSCFMLPCHKLAPMLACQPMTISRYRKKAIRDGHLKIVKKHRYCSAGKGEATEFQFLGHTIDWANRSAG
jgi:hypothetical protein